ncbi:hypothetical protein LVJ94_18800 [Pendulispora rubella]|uniref:Tetratricopeptide repeat protein 21A/21B fifth ARM repeats domain-containing protein n=1 Tax=Pendulispora rubella TaxID=2741070 RepID=A0ABZ2LET4_9BACT
MSDGKPPSGFLDGDDDFDWDAALDEWEVKSFENDPKAKSAEPQAEAQQAGEQGEQGTTPTMKPGPGVEVESADVEIPTRARAETPQGLIDLSGGDDDREGIATSVSSMATIESLRNAKTPGALSRSKAGLGQLFGRNLEPTAMLGDGSVVTSAKELEQTAQADKDERAETLESLRTTARMDREEPETAMGPLAEGAMYDPFAETFNLTTNDVPTAPPPARPTPLAPAPESTPTPEAAPTSATSSTKDKPQFLVPEFEFDRIEDSAEDPIETTGLRTRGATTLPGAAASGPVPVVRDSGHRAFGDEEEMETAIYAIHSPDGAPPSLRRSFLPPPVPPVIPPFQERPASGPGTEPPPPGKEGEAEKPPVSRSDVPPSIPPPMSAVPTFEGQKPASEWLSDEARNTMDARCAWLEEEARAAEDPAARARGLLAVSEMRAILGQRHEAEKLAAEARDAEPKLALSHRQARALAGDDTDRLQRIDATAVATTTEAGRLHERLLAVEAVRLRGEGEELLWDRWEQTWLHAPDDVRVVVGRAALALSHEQMASGALRVPEGPELALVAQAMESALRLRGVEVGLEATGERPALSEKGAASDKGDKKRTPDAASILRRARTALTIGQPVLAARILAEFSDVPELSGAAAWLSAALSVTDPDARASSLASLKGLEDRAAVRARAARGLELGDTAVVASALEVPNIFAPEEELVLRLFAGASEDLTRPLVRRIEGEEGLAPFAAAAAALVRGDASQAKKAAGDDVKKRAVVLGRLLAQRAPLTDIEEAALARRDDAPEESRALRLEVAFRSSRWESLVETLSSWEGGSRPSDRWMAAALIAERAGDRERALSAYRHAREQEPENEVALRAAVELDPSIDLASELRAMALKLEHGSRAALTAIEAVARKGQLDNEAKLELLEVAHRAAPSLPFASFLAERIARKEGDVSKVLGWVQKRKETASDPLEKALDSVREALLVADQDRAFATERLVQAQSARPDDVALRDLYERIAVDAPTDGASWREERAATAAGETRQRWLLEAAHAYEQRGDREGALRAALAAAAAHEDPLPSLERVVLERAELASGQVARLAEELLNTARQTEDVVVRREAYERLADLDAKARQDAASALLWHRTILEETLDHKPSLRHVEHALLSEARDDELEPVATLIARVLAGTAGGEAAAHAGIAARLRMRRGDWGTTYDLAALGKAENDPPIWALRLYNAHARTRRDLGAELEATRALLQRASRSAEVSGLLLRAGQAAVMLGRTAEGKELLERAITEDPADIVAWEKLAEARRACGETRDAASAYEMVAKGSQVPAHRVAAWSKAAQIWLDDLHDDDRGMLALKEAAQLDVSDANVFTRLCALYTKRNLFAELGALLEMRAATVTEPAERLSLEVERGRVLLGVGDSAGAKRALEAALALDPDHVEALKTYGEVSAGVADWNAAEQAWVRLSRLAATPEEQCAIYERLGDLYANHEVNLERAELAFEELLKRKPGDLTTLSRLVDVYRRRGDVDKALDLQNQLFLSTRDPVERRQRYIERASIYEEVANEPRKAEQTLEAARREFPTDVVVLRALAEFYMRHRQLPAVHILLDRAAADARRAFAAGRFAPTSFETMATVYELRSKKDAANVVSASLAAFSGKPANIQGAQARAGDARLDEVLAPDVVIPALRALLARTGDALDAIVPLDPRSVRAAPLPASAAHVQTLATTLATGMGITGCQVLVSPQVGLTCVPVSSTPPMIILGEALLLPSTNELSRTFLLMRALKLVQARASALLRIVAKDLPVLVAAWLHVFNPSWKPQGINPTALAEAARRLQAALPRKLDQDVGLMALEVAGSVGTQAAVLGPAVVSWADRTGLLAVGDPNAALEAIAWTLGLSSVPSDPDERADWISKTPQAREIIGYSVSDGYAEARARSGMK